MDRITELQQQNQELRELIGRLERLLAMLSGATRYTIGAYGKSITCHHCGSTSHSPNDVENRYCSHCHVFLDDQ